MPIHLPRFNGIDKDKQAKQLFREDTSYEVNEVDLATIFEEYKVELRDLKVFDEDGKPLRGLQGYVGKLYKYSAILEEQKSVVTNTVNGNNNLTVPHCANAHFTVPIKRPSPTKTPTPHKRPVLEANDDDDKMWANLLRHNIIPCGYDAIEDPRVDKELYKNLKLDPPLEVNGLFLSDQEKSDRLLASRSVDEFDSVLREFMSDDPKESFIHDASQIISANIFKKCRIRESEALYKYKSVWPLLELVAASASSESEVLMTPGETPLLAMNSDNKAKEDNRCVFNVDSTLRVDTLDNAEILTLEATGAYGFKDRSRCGYDYVKGAFSCLAMLRKPAHAYNSAGFELFSKLRMYFLHSKEGKIKLWAVYTPEPEINLMHLVKEAEIPGSFDELRVVSAVRAVESLKMERGRTLHRAHIFGEPLPDLRVQVNQTVVDLAKKDAPSMHQPTSKIQVHEVPSSWQFGPPGGVIRRLPSPAIDPCYLWLIRLQFSEPRILLALHKL
ncbi:hypothetical protein DFQ29_005380 [Apophysomyces sp. BC1021]|nr:hypothetical protein DFQ29_005380 [Apophysomyces sp. BC1021]